MAKIWYMREGGAPTIEGEQPRCILPFEKFKELFEAFETRYLGTGPPKFPSSKPALDEYRAPQFVVLEVAGKELADYPQMKEGFYLIDVPINHCEEILKGKSL